MNHFGNYLRKIGTVRTFAMALTLGCILLTGCIRKVEDTEKIRNLDFTVVKTEDIPESLCKMIEEQKEDAFQGTYEDMGYLYIVVCYGEQETTGYSIEMVDLCETENAVVISTKLLGPAKEEQILDKKTYPYIVIKLEAIDKDVQWR